MGPVWDIAGGLYAARAITAAGCRREAGGAGAHNGCCASRRADTDSAEKLALLTTVGSRAMVPDAVRRPRSPSQGK